MLPARKKQRQNEFDLSCVRESGVYADRRFRFPKNAVERVRGIRNVEIGKSLKGE